MGLGGVRAGSVAAVLLALGCGSSHGTGFSPATSTEPPSDGGGGSGDDSSAASDTGPQLVLTSADATPPGVTFDCKPGTYSGMFKVHVSTDAGLLPQLVSFDVAGSLSIVLVGKITQGSGGEFPEPILNIAPGAKLSGVDMTFGGTFNADVSGQLDCPKKTFSGTLNNGVYVYPGDSGSLMMVGGLSATYDGTMTPPALTNGVMDLGSPMLMLGSTGPWSATLQ
jgi:hypothetical protein